MERRLIANYYFQMMVFFPSDDKVGVNPLKDYCKVSTKTIHLRPHHNSNYIIINVAFLLCTCVGYAGAEGVSFYYCGEEYYYPIRQNCH